MTAERQVTKSESDKLDPVLGCVVRAIPNVANCLVYILDRNHMDSYDASCSAKAALDELMQAIAHMNIGS